MILESSIKEQTRAILKNIKNILRMIMVKMEHMPNGHVTF